MLPSKHAIKRRLYILRYYIHIAWTGKLEHINGRAIRDLNHLLRLNDVRKALGLESLPQDEYLGVRR